MSAATPYLAAEAATLGDKELPPRHHPRKVIPPHVIEELEYAADLFRRAERAMAVEMDVLAAAGIQFDPGVAVRVQAGLSGICALAAFMQLQVMRASEGRA